MWEETLLQPRRQYYNITCERAVEHMGGQYYMWEGNRTYEKTILHMRGDTITTMKAILQYCMWEGNRTCERTILHVRGQQNMWENNTTCERATEHVREQYYMWEYNTTCESTGTGNKLSL